MKHSIVFLLVSSGFMGILNGMETLWDKKIKQNSAAWHSYYFYQAVRAVEMQDKDRVELYCSLDLKLIPEIEQALTQELKQNKWAFKVITEIKLRNNARL